MAHIKTHFARQRNTMIHSPSTIASASVDSLTAGGRQAKPTFIFGY